MISNTARALLFAALFAAPLQTFAQSRPIFVANSVQAAGEVRAAYVAAMQGQRLLGVASALPLPGAKPGELLVVGRVLADNIDASPLSLLATVELQDGSVASTAWESGSDSMQEISMLGVEELRARLAATRAAQELRPDAGKQNAALSDLLKFERVIGGESLPADVEAHRQRLTELREIIRQRMATLSKQPLPPSFQKRQKDLAEQLNAITLAVKAEEARRREGAVGVLPDLQAKIDLIESTKDEHIDLLRKELLQVRKERGVSVPAGPKERP